VIYDEADPDIVNDMINDDEDVPGKDDVVQQVGDEKILKDIVRDGEEEKETIVDEVKPERRKWSDIVRKVSESEKKKKKDKYIEELAELNLDEEELQQATDMAESGEISEDDSKVSKGAGIISKLTKMK